MEKMGSEVQKLLDLRDDGFRERETTSASPHGQRPLLRRLSVRAKLISMICVTIVSLAGVGIFFLFAINEVKVSGPIYAAITREMDLRSDILPPRNSSSRRT